MAHRTRRVADLLKEEISLIIQRGIKDPRIGFITITHIKMSEDIKHAKIYFCTLETENNKSEVLDTLNNASQFIRAELKKVVHLKYIPYLKFFIDDTLEYVKKIEHLIEKTKE
ncbi:30S ribosome-binding factor RbfA [candidate division KSB1 bacterium]|nr:30S ribosome-binding factor RbfA [candidate division KSB1 bacterium]